MKRTSMAILVTLSALTASAAWAQTDETGVITSTDPQKVAEFEAHAQQVQAQQEAMPAPMHHHHPMRHHRPEHKKQ